MILLLDLIGLELKPKEEDPRLVLEEESQATQPAA
jgi:hypothetical protein